MVEDRFLHADHGGTAESEPESAGQDPHEDSRSEPDGAARRSRRNDAVAENFARNRPAATCAGPFAVQSRRADAGRRQSRRRDAGNSVRNGCAAFCAGPFAAQSRRADAGRRRSQRDRRDDAGNSVRDRRSDTGRRRSRRDGRDDAGNSVRNGRAFFCAGPVNPRSLTADCARRWPWRSRLPARASA